MLGVVIKKVDWKNCKILVEDLEALFSEDTEKSFEISCSEPQMREIQRIFGSRKLEGVKALVDERTNSLHFNFAFTCNMKCIQSPTNSCR